MAAHRYWRVHARCRQISGTYVFGLAEIEMRAAPGGPILTGSGTILTLQATDFPLVPANAFDGDSTTLWGRNGNEFVTPGYDFGTPTDVGEVRVVFGATGSARPGSTWSSSLTSVEYSDDGLTWGVMAPLLDLTAIGDGGVAVFLLAEPSPAQLGAPGWRAVGGQSALGGNRARAGAPGWRYDAADGGAYRVAGTVKIDGTPATPVARQVRLFDVISGRLIRATWSAPDGTFSFERIRAGEYLVVSDDYTRTYNAVVADRVMAVP